MKKEPYKNWVITASKDHVKNGEQGGFAQACHGKASPLKRMKNGDFVIYYSSKKTLGRPEKCQQFTAIGRVSNNSIYQVEISPDFSPFRIDIDFYESKDVSILPLIVDLEFIQNKQKWGYPFRWGILQINDHDFDLISKFMIDDRGSKFSF